jgi:hypothetical protein
LPNREHTSCAIARLAVEIDGDFEFAEEFPVFLAHPVHPFTGGHHLVGTADALHEIIEGLPQRGFDLFGGNRIS